MQLTDLVFLLDGSGSIGEDVFKRDVLPFVREFTRIFSISQKQTRVGIVQYSSDARVEFLMNKYDNRADLEKAINAVPYKEGGTYTGLAINYMMDKAFTEAAGARPVGNGVRRVGVVITDGASFVSSSKENRLLGVL